MMTNEMIKKEESNAMATVQETMKLCQMLMKTPHYQKMGQEGIFAIVQKAKAVGIDPLEALNGGLYFVQGKVEMTAGMMNDLIRRHGHSISKDKKSDDKICILHGKRRDNNDTWSESFSIEDAKTAGIYRNQWLKYPKDMLFARALSRLARQLFPDVIKGCYVDGEIVQATYQDVKEEETPMPEMGIEEARKMILSHIEIEEPEFLEEYLQFVQSKVQKPMTEVLGSWIKNPEPFLSHYSKWCIKKLIDTKSEIPYKEEREPSLYKEYA